MSLNVFADGDGDRDVEMGEGDGGNNKQQRGPPVKLAREQVSLTQSPLALTKTSMGATIKLTLYYSQRGLAKLRSLCTPISLPNPQDAKRSKSWDNWIKRESVNLAYKKNRKALSAILGMCKLTCENLEENAHIRQVSERSGGGLRKTRIRVTTKTNVIFTQLHSFCAQSRFILLGAASFRSGR